MIVGARLSLPPAAVRPSRRAVLSLLATGPMLSLLGPASTAAWNPSGVVIPGSALQADVELLARALRELHPGLLRYQSAADFEQRVAALRRELARDQSVADAFLALSRFTATIQCGHTWVSHFNQSKAIRTGIVEAGPRLPFWFEWIDGRMVVTRSFGAESLPEGTVVTAIDGTETRAILDVLLPYTRADGGNSAKRRVQLGVRGDATYEMFDVLYPWVFDRHGDRFTVRVIRPGTSRVASVIVRALTHAERVAPIAAREQERRSDAPATPLFEWTDDADGTAWLRTQSWAMYGSKWDWRSWLTTRLEALVARRAPALIIDLRGNEGGDDVGDIILEHLIDREVPVNALRRLVRYRELPSGLPREALDTWDDRFRNWGDEARELEQPWPTAPSGVQYFALSNGGERSRTLRPAAARFTGRVVVLVDAVNSSATFLFAQLVQQLRVGTLIGEPTGGNRRGINGGGYFFLRLPGSGLEVDLPLIGYFPATSQPDSGLVPDVVVRRTVDDIASDRDPVRLAVARLLARHSA